jgi:hypothetical protein
MFEQDDGNQQQSEAADDAERLLFLSISDVERAVDHLGAEVVVKMIKSKYRDRLLDALLGVMEENPQKNGYLGHEYD